MKKSEKSNDGRSNASFRRTITVEAGKATTVAGPAPRAFPGAGLGSNVLVLNTF